ncbi:hypothetical protein EYR36_000232 [Pleurotus pulmonarius]|nr:hypothetical protein EYR36_000232 [Pleurotus pulmonarius]
MTVVPNFLNLGSDALQRIIQCLDGMELIKLASLSRETHDYLLPLYLQRCNITTITPNDFSTVDTLSLNNDAATVEAFGLIRMSPQIAGLKHLHCKFHFPESVLLWEFRNLYSVVTKLRHVEAITLDFSLVPDSLAIHGVPRLKSMKAWRSAFGILLKAMLATSPRHLTVHDRMHFLWFVEIDVAATTTLRSKLHDALVGPTVIQREVAEILGLEDDKSSLWSRLAFAVTDSEQRPEDLSPLERVIGRVDLNSLTNICLDFDLTIHEWEIIGQYITLPSLSTFSAGVDSSNAFECLLQFLGRHPTVTSLHITDATVNQLHTYHIQTPFLPLLTSLRAPIDVFYIFFLSGKATPVSHLEDAEMSVFLRGPSDWSTVVRKLNSLPQIHKQMPITLRLLLRSKSWITPSPYIPIQRPIIDRLIIEARGQTFDVTQREVLPRWLSQFPHLQQLRILGTGVDCEGSFAQAIAIQHGNLRSVEFDGRIYTECL